MTAGRKCWCGRTAAADYPAAIECEEHDLPPATPLCPRTGIPTASCAHCRKPLP